MRVLQVLPQLGSGGVERTAVDIARALRGAGHTPHVASAGGPRVQDIEDAGGVHHVLPLASKNPLIWRKTAAGLSQLIRSNAIDIVHARSRAPAHPAARAARREGVPFVTTYHGIYNEANRFKRRYNSIMARSDHVIANSEFTKAHIMKTHGTEAGKITAIPRGVDLSAFPTAVPAARTAAIRRHWGVADAERVLFLPGRLTRWKGQTDAIRAMRGISGLTLVIQGDAQGRAHYVSELKALIAQSDARILLAGPHNDMAAAYAASFGVLSASNEPEAFGRVTAEGCAMGRPVIATAHGGSLEILEIGPKSTPLGLIAQPGDIASLNAQIRTLWAMDETQARDFASKAQTRARTVFTNSAMCAATLTVYRTLLGG